MIPKHIDYKQGSSPKFSEYINLDHELIELSEHIDWEAIEQQIIPYFKKRGRAAKPTRHVIGILMLQQMLGLSDEKVVRQWVENIYWQIFCGYESMQKKAPIHPTTLVKWRKRLGKSGLEKILAETIKAARKTQTISKNSAQQVTVDTTVMEKNITYPTDAKLFHSARKNLVHLCKKLNITLRQSYTRNSKKALFQASRYIHARQMNRARKCIKKLKTYLGRTVRDISRKIKGSTELERYFAEKLEVAKQILSQEKQSSNKTYSVHEPKVECITKGKVHKKYEFGCKVSLVVTHKGGLVLSSQALHGNSYDGHTLQDALSNAEALSNTKIRRAFVDKGYKGHKIKGKEVFISGQKQGVTKHLKTLLKKRQAIEPHIGGVYR